MRDRDRFVHIRKPRAALYIYISIAFIAGCVFIWINGKFSLLTSLILLGLALMFALGFEVLHYLARNMAVTLDYTREIVVLEHFVYPLSFLDFHRKSEVVIPFDEIQHVTHTYSNGSITYWVYTKLSRFSFGSGIDRAAQLATELSEIASNTERMNPLRSMWVIAFAAGFTALAIVALLGWMLGWI